MDRDREQDEPDPVCAAYRRVARVMREEAARLADCAPLVAERLTVGSDRLRDAARGWDRLNPR